MQTFHFAFQQDHNNLQQSNQMTMFKPTLYFQQINHHNFNQQIQPWQVQKYKFPKIRFKTQMTSAKYFNKTVQKASQIYKQEKYEQKQKQIQYESLQLNSKKLDKVIIIELNNKLNRSNDKNLQERQRKGLGVKERLRKKKYSDKSNIQIQKWLESEWSLFNPIQIKSCEQSRQRYRLNIKSNIKSLSRNKQYYFKNTQKSQIPPNFRHVYQKYNSSQYQNSKKQKPIITINGTHNKVWYRTHFLRNIYTQFKNK